MVTANRATEHSAGSVTELPAGFRSHSLLCQQLERIAPGWLEERFAETEIIAALPRFQSGGDSRRLVWRAALPSLSLAEIEVEADLSRACADGSWLGISRHGFVDYRFIGSRSAKPNDPFRGLLQSMRELGWQPRYLHQVRRTMATGNDLHGRTVGAAGWMICRQEFRAERDALLVQWQQLDQDSRPPLPLQRSPQLEVAPAESRRQRKSHLAEFHRSFNAFCEKWELLGMITWDLPNADGPKWSDDYPGRPPARDEHDFMRTPWHFPLEGKDGLGRILEERHRRRAAERGFTDQRRWETYARFLMIDFWERVICSRYASRRDAKPDVTRIVAVITELTGCDNETINKRRRTLREFQQGTRTSLRGMR